MASIKHKGSESWRTQLHEAKALHLKCASKGDFTEWFQVYPSRAFDKTEAVTTPDPNEVMWQSSANTLVTEHQQITATVEDTSNNLKATSATQTECITKFKDSKEQAVADSAAAISNVYNDAAEKIEPLPPAAQLPALNGLMKMMGTFNTFWGNVLGNFQTVLYSFVAWLQSVWQEVSQAWVDANSTFKAAVSWVESL